MIKSRNIGLPPLLSPTLPACFSGNSPPHIPDFLSPTLPKAFDSGNGTTRRRSLIVTLSTKSQIQGTEATADEPPTLPLKRSRRLSVIGKVSSSQSTPSSSAVKSSVQPILPEQPLPPSLTNTSGTGEDMNITANEISAVTHTDASTILLLSPKAKTNGSKAGTTDESIISATTNDEVLSNTHEEKQTTHAVEKAPNGNSGTTTDSLPKEPLITQSTSSIKVLQSNPQAHVSTTRVDGDEDVIMEDQVASNSPLKGLGELVQRVVTPSPSTKKEKKPLSLAEYKSRKIGTPVLNSVSPAASPRPDILESSQLNPNEQATDNLGIASGSIQNPRVINADQESRGVFDEASLVTTV